MHAILRPGGARSSQMRSETVKQSALRREAQSDPNVVDLTAYEGDKSEAAATARAERAREFYRENTQEVIARMRNPTTPANNIAAGIVLQCETNPRLRAEAEKALEVAREAGEARSALDIAIGFYDSPGRS
jgi:hypothetical protein